MLGLPEYARRIEDNGIKIDVPSELTDRDLKSSAFFWAFVGGSCAPSASLDLRPQLSAFELEAIRSCAKRHFGEGCVVRLFSSRTDDARRGGDIDLHIEAETSELASLSRELEFKEALQELIGEQKVDVVLRPPNHPPRSIDIVARETGVRL